MSSRSLIAAALGLALAACHYGIDRDEAAASDAPPAVDSALLARAGVLENAAIDSLPVGAGKDVLLRACTSCHSAVLITQQRKPPEEWVKTVDKMVSWGAPLPPEEKQTLVDYLATMHPISPPVAMAAH